MSTVSKLQVSDDVVNRIRDSRDDRDNELAGICIRYGREWAKNEAEHQHLVNIEANLQPLGDDHADPNSIARVIETGRSDNDSTHFWEEVLGEDSPEIGRAHV